MLTYPMEIIILPLWAYKHTTRARAHTRAMDIATIFRDRKRFYRAVRYSKGQRRMIDGTLDDWRALWSRYGNEIDTGPRLSNARTRAEIIGQFFVSRVNSPPKEFRDCCAIDCRWTDTTVSVYDTGIANLLFRLTTIVSLDCTVI